MAYSWTHFQGDTVANQREHPARERALAASQATTSTCDINVGAFIEPPTDS